MKLITLFKYLSLFFATFVVLFPIYTIFVGAFKTKEEIYQSQLTLPHSFFNFDNFGDVLSHGRLALGFMNIGIIMMLSIVGNVLLGSMASYAIGRFEFKFKKWIMGAYLLAAVIPLVTTQVATFSVIKFLHLFNTIYAPVVLFLGADVIQMIIYLQFIRNIPKELDESAMLDGASLFRIYRSIIFPLLAPATATVIILKSISVYNNFYIPYLYMPARELRVISTAIYSFVGPNAAQWQNISAGILIIFIPTILLFLFFQRYIFSGVTSGAVK